MATLMSDEVFHEVAYRAKNRDHLLAGVDEFLDAVTVLPPGEWDPQYVRPLLLPHAIYQRRVITYRRFIAPVRRKQDPDRAARRHSVPGIDPLLRVFRKVTIQLSIVAIQELFLFDWQSFLRTLARVFLFCTLPAIGGQ